MTATLKQPKSNINVFSVDVEDYYQVTGFERQIDRSQWPNFESRVEASTKRILELLARHDVRGTFFVLGWTGDRYPDLVREIHSAGHEVGSHSYWHRLVYRQSPDEFRRDLRQSRDVLSDIIGQRIVSYRAPTFSITNKSLWALEILVEEGFQADSSIFPIRHDRYGIPNAKREPHQINTPSGDLWEFPPAVARWRRRTLPVAGGGYFRLFPLRVTLRGLRSIRHPFMFYTHPWELDPDQPRLKAGSRLGRFRHYVNLDKTQRRLDVLLKNFRFSRLRDVVGAQGDRNLLPERPCGCLAQKDPVPFPAPDA